MTELNNDLIKSISQTLDNILLNKPFVPLKSEGLPENISALVSKINSLGLNISQLNSLLIDLSNGKLDGEAPPRSNYLAAAVKQLQSHLNHLTWQTQQIAKGDYNQKVEFMGDFASSFNILTTQLQERESGLKARNEILWTIFENIECLFIFNAQNRKEAFYINDFAKRTFRVGSDLNFYDANTSDFVNQLTTMQIDSLKERELHDTATGQWFRVVISEIQWLNNAPALLFYCINITGHKQQQFELEKNAFIDPLTELNNRRSLDLHLNEVLQYAQRLQKNISIYILDIDLFKKYNDTYGHLQGDVCLKSLAKCLKSLFTRTTDFIARFGGEEFIIVSLNMTPESAFNFGEKLRSEVEKLPIPIYNNYSEITHITVSIGVYSVIAAADTTANLMIAKADAVLYRSKAEGRNRTTLAD